MSVSAFATGTQTAVITTEHTLADVNLAGTYTLHVDTINLAAGDVVELRVYQMVLTAGTRRVCFFTQFHGAQPVEDLIKVSVPISNELTDTGALRFSLKQVFGTGRDFPFKILRHA
jgi:hypothetical protein